MALVLNITILRSQQGLARSLGLCLWSLKLPNTVRLAVCGVSPHVPSSSLESSALTCSGGSFYRFVVSHLNPVTEDKNLRSGCQLQQKIMETRMSLRLHSYPGNGGGNTKAPVATTESAGEAPRALARLLVLLPSPHNHLFWHLCFRRSWSRSPSNVPRQMRKEHWRAKC